MTPLVWALIALTAWVFNIYKLAECDFASPYRCEVIHAVGIFPPAALITVWFGTDSDPKE